MPTSKRQRLTAAVLSLGLIGSSPAAIAAENVVFVTGAFRRSIAVTDLEFLAETGQARGLMADVLTIAKQKPEEVSKLLNAELSIPLLLTSRLLSTRLGEALLARIAQIVYPLYAKRSGIPALLAVLQKAKSVSELIQFFMESPLDGLRGGAGSPAAGSEQPAKPAP